MDRIPKKSPPPGVISRLALVPLLVLAGCDAGGAMWYTMFGPSKVPAKFSPPNEPTLILVENYRNPTITQSDGLALSRMVGDRLTKNKVVPLIDPDTLQNLRDANPESFRQLSIAAVGKAVGAKQIIYIDLIEAVVDHDSAQQMLHAHGMARVRVIDAATGNTLWPRDQSQGYEVNALTQLTRDEGDHGPAAHAEMMDSLTSSICHLFYDWKPDTESQGTKG